MSDGRLVTWSTYHRPIPVVKVDWQESGYEWIEFKWCESELSWRQYTRNSGLEIKSAKLSSESDAESTISRMTGAGFSLIREGKYPVGAIDYLRMSVEIQRYAQAALDRIISELNGQSLCGFALASDSDAMTLSARATTREAVSKPPAGLSRDEARFIVGEWPIDDPDRSQLAFISTMNAKRDWPVPFDPQGSHQRHRRQFFGACVRALASLRRDGAFRPFGSDCLVLYETMDDAGVPFMSMSLNPWLLALKYKLTTWRFIA